MKRKLLLTLICALGVVPVIKANSIPEPTDAISLVLEELEADIQAIELSYELEYKTLYMAIRKVRDSISKSTRANTLVPLILEKDRLTEMLRQTKKSERASISKVRYLKGLQIIKLIFEKILALDHHFESITTFNEISAMANPNHYAEFKNVKGDLAKQMDKRQGFKLPDLLGNNIYTSVIHSFVTLFSGGNSKNEKQQSINEIECILDFTLSMHNDLNTIFFETSYLKSSNQTIMYASKNLFQAYTKPIGYTNSLENCRNTDDWDQVKSKLDDYLEQLQEVIKIPEKADQAFKLQVNLEFSIDRLLQFISQYNTFIDQGEKFYKKFAIMLDSYQNQQLCSSQIPDDFFKLKSKIERSVEKFNTAYKPVEINGSKLKEVLYGINEFD